ncbi:MAG: AtpZ/AtpI family protein [Chloroflexi bacterium]|nr:AtpZ/AtpI family protein [Chloroflexota bacterium]
MKDIVLPIALILQLMVMIVVISAGSLLVGVWLDRRLGTTPILIIVFMIIGLVLTMLTVYRIAKRYEAALRSSKGKKGDL